MSRPTTTAPSATRRCGARGCRGSGPRPLTSGRPPPASPPPPRPASVGSRASALNPGSLIARGVGVGVAPPGWGAGVGRKGGARSTPPGPRDRLPAVFPWSVTTETDRREAQTVGLDLNGFRCWVVLTHLHLCLYLRPGDSACRRHLPRLCLLQALHSSRRTVFCRDGDSGVGVGSRRLGAQDLPGGLVGLGGPSPAIMDPIQRMDHSICIDKPKKGA